uniref:hypothetical protein n=1 Tax=Enterobacter cloacae complex sp. TaxID=2027919 RepID=UPI001C33E972|nr:hypothetical protein [Enterobacter cloacae complex sp.]QVQ59756.1 hypothetical protein [Enterobacter cloacae complex sp.]
MGTAERLKTLYPELDSWHPVLVTKAWLHWCDQHQQEAREPSKRDERFPDYIIHLLLENMRAEDSAKRKKGQTLSLSERLDRLFAGKGRRAPNVTKTRCSGAGMPHRMTGYNAETKGCDEDVNRLCQLYPEIASWQPELIAGAWRQGAWRTIFSR